MPGLHMSAYAPPGSMPWSVPQYSAVMSTQSMLSPGLKFFIERDNGSFVPLLPVDELPDDVRLVGVPLSLTASQTKNMLFLGHDSSIGRKFSHVASLSINESAVPSPVTMKYTPQPEVARRNNHVLQLIHTQPVASNSKPLISSKPRPLYNERPLPPSGIEPDQRKKVYCTYWIQNQGQCAYKQQGCMYKHEIPEDKETLKSIGLKSVPAWWRKEQAQKKQKQKRTERNGSSSEWEVVERQQNDKSALHSDGPARVCVPPSGPSGIQTTKQAAQKYHQAPAVQKNTVTSDVAADAAPTGSSAPGLSPPGGVKLGAAKTPVRGPPSLLFKKQTLEPPIGEDEEENLIDFDVLVPSSSPDIFSSSQSSLEALADQRSQAEATTRDSTIVTRGGVFISSGRGVGHRSSNSGRTRRESADKKAGTITPPRQHNSKVKVKGDAAREKADHGNGMPRRGRVKMAHGNATAKVTGEVDLHADDEA